MGRKFDQDLHALIPGQLLVEIAIGLIGFREASEALDLFFHQTIIGRANCFPSRNHEISCRPERLPIARRTTMTQAMAHLLHKE
jgi:hypothetical protein